MASVEEYKICFESQFESWMTWENRGWGPGTWQEDHIIPKSFFDHSDPVEQYMCFRLQNLRPISWEENMKKFNKIIEHDALKADAIWTFEHYLKQNN
jgi:hypothetical protein